MRCCLTPTRGTALADARIQRFLCLAILSGARDWLGKIGGVSVASPHGSVERKGFRVRKRDGWVWGLRGRFGVLCVVLVLGAASTAAALVPWGPLSGAPVWLASRR